MIEDAVILLLHIAILCADILCTVIEILLLLLTEMRFLNFTTVSIYELHHDKPVLMVSDKGWYKAGCSTTG